MIWIETVATSFDEKKDGWWCHLLCVFGHTLDVDVVKLATVRVERVKRRDRLLVETAKAKPGQVKE